MTKDLRQCVGELHGRIPDLTAPPTDEYPKSEEVWWAEAVKLDLEVIDGKYYLLLKPVVWIWPKRARILATDFLDRRGGGRFNKAADALLSAWIRLLLPTASPGVDLALSPLEGERDAGHPHFMINGRTAFSRRAIV